jgi:hypothetical protein
MMDARSRDVTAFLEALGREAGRLFTEVKGHYTSSRAGRIPRMPILSLTSKDLILALPIKGADGADYEVAVDVTWDPQRWTITSGTYRDSDRGGQETVQQLPERSATDLEVCLEQIHAAIGDLTRFADLIP